MFIPRLLVLSVFRTLFLTLLISVSVAPLAAQSSTDKRAVSSQTSLMLPQNAQSADRSHPPSDLTLRTRTLVEQDTECLYIRSYRVTRDDPQSDSTRFAGYSECQPVNRYQMKTAVETREIGAR